MLVSRECPDLLDHLVTLDLMELAATLDPEDLLDPTDPLVRMVEPAAMELLDLLEFVDPLDTLDLLVLLALPVCPDLPVPLVVDMMSLVDMMSTELTSPL